MITITSQTKSGFRLVRVPDSMDVHDQKRSAPSDVPDPKRQALDDCAEKNVKALRKAAFYVAEATRPDGTFDEQTVKMVHIDRNGLHIGATARMTYFGDDAAKSLYLRSLKYLGQLIDAAMPFLVDPTVIICFTPPGNFEVLPLDEHDGMVTPERWIDVKVDEEMPADVPVYSLEYLKAEKFPAPMPEGTKMTIRHFIFDKGSHKNETTYWDLVKRIGMGHITFDCFAYRGGRFLRS